jgi:hypothetical protein
VLSLVGLAILRGPATAAQDIAALLSTAELRELVARLIDHLDAIEPDPDAEPDQDLEPDSDAEPDHDDEPVMAVPRGDDWPHQASGQWVVPDGETPRESAPASHAGRRIACSQDRNTKG